MTLWEVDIHPAPGQPDLIAQHVASQAADVGLPHDLKLSAARGFLIQGDLSRDQIDRLARELLGDTIVERTVVAKVGDATLLPARANLGGQLIHVLPKPGVTDPVALSTQRAIADFGFEADAVCTLTKYWVDGLSAEQVALLSKKILANDSIEQLIAGPLTIERIDFGTPAPFQLNVAPIRELNDAELVALSKQWQLSLTLVEMQTIQAHFREQNREPTDAELETIAQTWSEHCSHKTLAGKVRYRDEHGEHTFQNMLKETIFAATQQIRKQQGQHDWCVSVFKDNAGIVKFDDENHVCFKVETHNRPSAIEPYGGANTGVGGVIRDTLGTGLGAKPICNTDIFCFAPPNTPVSELPPGVLHPRRIMRGVVSGVRDYGNRMGIPTVNGAIYFDPRYVGNPLVFCGNVGLIPVDKAEKEVQPNDYIVSIGGRTGRDGIHGATFSSAELTHESERISGGAVQIGNAITEKMAMDVLLLARDRGLFNAVTDCGAGGFSSAVGEMGEETGAEVWLDRAPLKYAGLTYTEIWISEAQERMVFAVPPAKWEAFHTLCASEGVEATIIGQFKDHGRLILKYQDHQVADVTMAFLHKGRPPVVRDAVYNVPAVEPFTLPAAPLPYGDLLVKLLGSLNIASKEWVIRQYDHEVQGGSVIKPLVGVANDGPSDAAVVRPVLSSRRGLVIGCGMNPRYGEFDAYHMATSAIDEAVRNCVAVGADPSHIAVLDNFCWGYTDRPETLGSLVRAALGCHDAAIALQTPFISGKDSLNNEFSYVAADGQRQTISIPPTLLISALGQVADVAKCVTMDLKSPGNKLYIVGVTKNELGGSHLGLVAGLTGGRVPQVNFELADEIFDCIHGAIHAGRIRACHDLSEGGLAVALAEMAFAGGCGASVDISRLPHELDDLSRHEAIAALLFAESNSRFLCEVPAEHAAQFEVRLAEVPFARIGEVTAGDRLVLSYDGAPLIDADLATLKAAWQAPLNW
ncbi:MAG TPA: phosphoribosylformylglycinamidine synthase subunit PurL [Pirellulaceae bacterium]|nr:phosphoribosylformylglycinamidine synthase subunit PurL [Pirellulaceae bacterium]